MLETPRKIQTDTGPETVKEIEIETEKRQRQKQRHRQIYIKKRKYIGAKSEDNM